MFQKLCIINSIFIIISSMAGAAPTTFKPGPTFEFDHSKLEVYESPQLEAWQASLEKVRKAWAKPNRKVASEMSFSESQLSPDMVKFREAWLKVKNADEMEALLKKSNAEYANYSADLKYFLAQLHLSIPLRGIVWRVRPIFEKGDGSFLGNTATHVAAVQMVRQVGNAIEMAMPTEQWSAGFDYFTIPSADMTKAQQFKSIFEYQNFLATELVPALNQAISRITQILDSNATDVFVWDNKIVYGTGTFVDGINRFVGYGAPEVLASLGVLYRAVHDIRVFCAYNQDQMMAVAGELSKQFGVDSGPLFKTENLGLTDRERSEVVTRAVRQGRFLELRNYKNSQYGTKMMAEALKNLKASVAAASESYELLQGKRANPAMALNPIKYQPEVANLLSRGVANMKAVVAGQAEVRDPVSGQTVTLNVPNFYLNPPTSLSALMPTHWVGGKEETTFTNKSGEKISYRNYSVGSADGWNNNEWKKYVPSAAGKDLDYMAEARRVMAFSLGTSLVFGPVAMFVH